MDRRFSNATLSLADAALKLCTELANYWRTVLADQGVISSRAALYARPWPEVARGSRPFAFGAAMSAGPLGFWKWSGITAASRRKFQGTP